MNLALVLGNLLCPLRAEALVRGEVLERDAVLEELVDLLERSALDLGKELRTVSTKLGFEASTTHGGVRHTNQKKTNVTAFDAAQM